MARDNIQTTCPDGVEPSYWAEWTNNTPCGVLKRIEELEAKVEQLETAGREMAELLTPAWSDFVGLETLEVDAGIAHECVAKFMSLVGEQ